MKIWVVTVAVFLGVTISGCMVSKSKFEAATADMESAKVELEKSRMHNAALEKQISNYKSVSDKLSTDLEMMTAEVQRIKESRENDQTRLNVEKEKLNQERQQSTTQVRVLKREYQKVKSQNKALKDTVLRYQKELKEARGKKIGSTFSPVGGSQSLSAPSTSTPSSTSAQKSPQSKVASVPSPKREGLPPVNINSASVSDLVLFLGLTKEMAENVVAKRPYRLRGELVAKKVLPKATFDVIKDRITATR